MKGAHPNIFNVRIKHVQMIRIAVVEDDIYFQEKIIKKCKEFYHKRGISSEVVAFSKPSLVLYDIGDKQKFDIYLLDIELPECNGITLGEKIRLYQQEAFIVFITFHMEFSIDGYTVHAFQYISKYNFEENLDKTLSIIQEKMDKRKGQYYLIKTPKRYERIFVEDIFCIYKENKNAVFIVRGEEAIEYRESLKNIYKKLPQNEFIFVDRGYIVNILHVMKIKGNRLFLRNKSSLPMSRGHIEDIKEKIYMYWKDYEI
ncbi:hypothetical protein K040078D81_44250 [Blautia hominis]|uniref:Stage 0 sporulation protein A homolog n=1 Tax=Blautia hominis TaxID=2025493 RepID=A0ABQ0BFT1_9FIRM